MPKAKRTYTEEQKQAMRERLAAARAKKVSMKEEKVEQKTNTEQPAVLPPVAADSVPEVAKEQSYEELQRQVNEMKQNQELMLMALRGQQNTQGTQGATLGFGGKLLGEVEKYAVDPSRYPDPTRRLAKEPRLAPLAFDYNYELGYEVAVSSYETKTGANFKEPKFLITLNRIVLDESGAQTNKRYIARRMVFHEDPQAAIVIARDNGIDLKDYEDMDNTDENQRLFLNEMRYLRVRDWLFDVFWPKGVDAKDSITEEVIGGSIVQVFTKNSEDPSGVDFDKIKTVLR